jgi:hypothetical protein
VRDHPGPARGRDHLPLPLRPNGGPLPRPPPAEHKPHQGARRPGDAGEDSCTRSRSSGAAWQGI